LEFLYLLLYYTILNTLLSTPILGLIFRVFPHISLYTCLGVPYTWYMTILFDEEKQEHKLDEINKREQEDVAQILADRYGLTYADLGVMPINMDALRLIPEKEARDAKVAAFSMVGERLKIAVLSPANEKLPKVFEPLERKGFDITKVVVSPDSLEKAWKRYVDLSYSTETKAGAFDISGAEIEEFIKKVNGLDDVRRLIEEVVKMKKAYRISKILEIVMSGALALKASDIHVEPEETYVRLRYRLDGVLTDILTFDHETYNQILSRIKLLSGLKLNLKSEAQDGRFSVKIGTTSIEIRTSMLPGAYSESVVLRILNPNSIQVPLENMGMGDKILKIVLYEISRPNGMILTTGPTGSGKTTTLYAFMRKVHTPDVKIITIEDPIEYHLPGIVQTQVNSEKNYTFAAGLRSALRQDPDVIMVGEIRDNETAEIAVNSSLTGHLVFSTLHTNSAAGTYPRLIDLGVNPKTLTSAINVALAQRLVRKLCPECKEKIEPTDKEKILISKTLGEIVDRSLVEKLDPEHMYKPVGCAKCHNMGYSGRVGIYEAILTDAVLEKTIEMGGSAREITLATRPQGIPSMKEDGVMKVLMGVTSLDELSRVIDLTENM
jgi:type II secretory ATPase GspE/PulE/Tfp pilus assembly ATPase PilB-like protein